MTRARLITGEVFRLLLTFAHSSAATDGDSDREMNEWENQQIRKGVTAAQLVHSQHETVLSRFMIKPAPSGIGTGMDDGDSTAAQSTSTLLEQAYAKNALERTNLAAAVRSSVKTKKEKAKATALRTPQEILAAIQSRLSELKERSADHSASMARISTELKALKLQQLECQQNAPTAAAKYKFYQEIKCYVNDLVDCLSEKAPVIYDLEKRALQQYGKNQRYLVNRRRQDVRDQAKEIAESASMRILFLVLS